MYHEIDQNEAKMLEILQTGQFEAINNTVDSVVINIEKDLNINLLSLKKSKDISEHLYSKLRSTCSQPARLYGLAELHRKIIPLRPALSPPGISYENLNKILTTF